MTVFAPFAVVVGFVAGGVASIAGFGIGSLLTPLLALRLGMQLAVAVVAVPHFAGTALRWWRLRAHVDRRVFGRFGVASAAGGLLGSIAHGLAPNAALAIVLGALLVFAGALGVAGASNRLRFGRRTGWLAGALSGAFGGLVGNQGGIRSAALLGFDLPKEAFVATATAIAIVVDVVRLPVYLVSQGQEMMRAWPLLANATAGVLAGTVVGERVLGRIPERTFRVAVSSVILLLGVALLLGVGR
ncbi:MAG TPA: sulfite exporter TauE/SafE family protein [Candidatus Binatia bacterium]|nr:sulfite exporter TauE/SafE family protein [Candidatus Binatia bacterium]